jgi:ABC-type cobalamin transport system ATPase subunit
MNQRISNNDEIDALCRAARNRRQTVSNSVSKHELADQFREAARAVLRAKTALEKYNATKSVLSTARIARGMDFDADRLDRWATKIELEEM